MVLHMEGPALHSQTEFAFLEHLAKEVSEEGEQDAAPVLRAGGSCPVDVEILSVGRGLAVLEHIVPPGVLVAENAHVVGDDVQEQT